VRLIVEIIEPFHGRIYDPACGSGGMFVQSANFVAEHKKRPTDEISVCGVEKMDDTLRLAKINLAVHGLSGDIKEANSYYEDPHQATGKFDFVMANPPFNQNAVDKDRIKDDKKRYPFGMPSVDNANYLWISLFYSALSPKGRAGFVMANSAADARGTELEMRRKLLATGAVDVIVSMSANLFYTVTLPATLWFLDRGKTTSDRKDKVLFIDARHHFVQVDRAHREMTPEQVEFLGNIVRLFREEAAENRHGSAKLTKQHFPKGKYADVAGLCKVATLKQIKPQDWSLNPGRYVGATEREDDGVDFKVKLEELNEQLEMLNAEARELEERIAANATGLLEA